MVAAAGAGKPLPDELPAAALWWRLSRHLGPAAVTANAASATLRPEWTLALLEVLGQRLTRNVLADPAWPSLVAAVSDAISHGWQPAQVLSTAFELLSDGQDGAPIAGNEIATALAWRIAMLTEANTPAYTSSGGTGTTDQEVPLPAEPADLLDPTDFLDPASLYGTAGGEGTDDLDEESTSLSAEDQQWLAAHDWAPSPTGPEESPAGIVITPAPATAQPAKGDPGTSTGDQEGLHKVTPSRIADLNEQALAFFTDRFPDSWAAPYLQERLGTDLSDDDRFHPGYAPAGWTGMTDHLRIDGATDEELLAAGLATQASTGRLIDRFRDRLVLPIYHGDQVHGFVGRRNPDTDDAGPKYLNTADTALFTKGDQLYGAAEAASQLAAGATPVLVEGPIDAIAVTLAGGTDYVGVAPLGTAFTDTQADSLVGVAGPSRVQPVVATDGDTAGRKAADRAYWMLTQRGYNHGHAPMPNRLDPADLARLHGPEALLAALHDQVPLAASLVQARVARHADRLDTPEGKVLAVRAAAQVIAALPPQHWKEHIEQLATLVDPAPGVVHLEVFEAGQAWTDDPAAATRRHLAERPQPINPSTTSSPSTREVTAAAAPSAPSWAQLAAGAHPPLPQDSEWPQLEAALVRAEAAGYPVAAALPRLIAAAPLPDDRPARAVQYRLIAETAAAMTPIDWRLEVAADRAVAEEANQRMARDDPPAAAGDPEAFTDPELLAGRDTVRLAEASIRAAATHGSVPEPSATDGDRPAQEQSQQPEPARAAAHVRGHARTTALTNRAASRQTRSWGWHGHMEPAVGGFEWSAPLGQSSGGSDAVGAMRRAPLTWPVLEVNAGWRR